MSQQQQQQQQQQQNQIVQQQQQIQAQQQQQQQPQQQTQQHTIASRELVINQPVHLQVLQGTSNTTQVIKYELNIPPDQTQAIE